MIFAALAIYVCFAFVGWQIGGGLIGLWGVAKVVQLAFALSFGQLLTRALVGLLMRRKNAP
jgi:hypothetical protein